MTTFTHPATGEPVNREAWRWVACYNDGTTLSQFDDQTGRFHQFAEIDQSKLYLFKMVHDSLPEQLLVFPSGAKLVHKYINTILNAGLESELRTRVYGYGYELGGRSFLHAILPDNAVVHTEDLNVIRIS